MNDFYKLYRKDVEIMAKDIIDDIISLAASLYYEKDTILEDVLKEIRKLNARRGDYQNELS